MISIRQTLSISRAFWLMAIGLSAGAALAANPWLDRARALADSGDWQASRHQITLAGWQSPQWQSILSPAERIECQWLDALCAFQTDDPGAPALLEALLQSPDATPEIRQNAALTLGDWLFFHRQFGPAARQYLTVGIPSSLSSAQKPLYSYRLAVSLIKAGDIDAGEPYLRYLRSSSAYAPAAKFYRAYCDYARGDYAKALQGFSEVASQLPSGQTVRTAGSRKSEYIPTGLEAGYYIMQIEFIQGKYSQAAQHGRLLLERQPVPEFIPETRRVVGESYYRLGEYRTAESFLENYVDDPGEGTEPVASALYSLGVVKYELNDLRQAAALFDRVADERSAIGQSAALYLGQIAVREGRPSEAAVSFSNAYEMAYDPAVSEAALYDYVVAVIHGGSVPFQSGTPLLEDFLVRFPNSEHAAAVDEYLATAYFNEKQYAKALTALRRIQRPDQTAKAALQKVLFANGEQALNQGRAAAAVPFFREAASMTAVDKALALQSSLWLGDALYQTGDFKGAAAAYRNLTDSPAGTQNRTLALYDYAYALYRQGQYASAAKAFSNALSARPELPSPLRNDARIRRADCLYYTGDYRAATSEYTRAISDGASDADYAMYRRAVMYGLAGDIKGKIAELNSLASQFPQSPWRPAAMLEKAITYQGLDQTGDAEASLNALIASYPDAAESRKALLQLAISQSRRGDDAAAMESYREVISRWPTSEEAQLANADLRQIYAAQGRLQEYALFLKSVPQAPQLSHEEMDRLAYEAAALAFAEDGDYSHLEKYVREFPNGRYLTQASAELQRHQEEVQRYEQSLAQARNTVTLGEQLLADKKYDQAEELLTSFTDEGSEHPYWLARGFIALADVLHAKGKTYLAKEYLKSLKNNYPGSESDIRQGIENRLNKWK